MFMANFSPEVRKARDGDSRLQPIAIYETILKQRLDSLLAFQAFAERQHEAGDPRWVQLLMRSGRKKACASWGLSVTGCRQS